VCGGGNEEESLRALPAHKREKRRGRETVLVGVGLPGPSHSPVGRSATPECGERRCCLHLPNSTRHCPHSYVTRAAVAWLPQTSPVCLVNSGGGHHSPIAVWRATRWWAPCDARQEPSRATMRGRQCKLLCCRWGCVQSTRDQRLDWVAGMSQRSSETPPSLLRDTRTRPLVGTFVDCS
jgi:hypothetical protein